MLKSKTSVVLNVPRYTAPDPRKDKDQYTFVVNRGSAAAEEECDDNTTAVYTPGPTGDIAKRFASAPAPGEDETRVDPSGPTSKNTESPQSPPQVESNVTSMNESFADNDTVGELDGVRDEGSFVSPSTVGRADGRREG